MNATAEQQKPGPARIVKMWLLLAVLIGALIFVSKPPKSAVAWRTDWQQAVDESIETKLPIFVEFYGPGCTYCELMDRTVFTREDVAEALSGFVPAKINADKERRLAFGLGVQAYPTFFVLTPGHDVVAKHIGAMEPEEFIAFTKTALQKRASLEEIAR
mgnify:CR=1 FL=1